MLSNVNQIFYYFESDCYKKKLNYNANFNHIKSIE